MDLITKYQELAQYVKNVNGSLQMSEEGMQKYLNQQYAEKQKAYADSIQAQRTAQQSTPFFQGAQAIANKT